MPPGSRLTSCPTWRSTIGGSWRRRWTRLRGKVRYQPLGFELLPEQFTLRQLQHLYEIVLGRPLDKRNFRKKVLGMGILKDTREIENDVAHRAARLFRFDKQAYDRLARRGFLFEL